MAAATLHLTESIMDGKIIAIWNRISFYRIRFPVSYSTDFVCVFFFRFSLVASWTASRRSTRWVLQSLKTTANGNGCFMAAQTSALSANGTWLVGRGIWDFDRSKQEPSNSLWNIKRIPVKKKKRKEKKNYRRKIHQRIYNKTNCTDAHTQLKGSTAKIHIRLFLIFPFLHANVTLFIYL